MIEVHDAGSIVRIGKPYQHSTNSAIGQQFIDESTRGVCVLWHPQANITLHELAAAMPLLLRLTNGGFLSTELDDYPEAVTRHFVVKGK